jgi:protease I
MKLKGKKIAVLAGPLYEDLELWYPYYRLKEEGALVKLVGVERGPETVESKHGYPAKIEQRAQAANQKEYDAVIIPGGYSPDHLRRDPAMVAFVKAMNQSGKVVAAICHGGWMLASAQALRGKKATSFFAIKDDMVNAGAEWIDQEVVVDGNLVTSRAPDDLPAFMREIIRLLAAG